MIGLENGHRCKNLTQNGEPQRQSWGTQKKKKKKIVCRVLELITEQVYIVCHDFRLQNYKAHP